MPNAGRNDPCPCRNGQKYKKCCLAKADAARAAERPRLTARETVMPPLLRFTESAQFDRDHQIADVMFWSDRLDDLDDDEAEDLFTSDDAIVKYNSWFIWDLDIDGGVTVADMFLAQKGRTLEPAERAFVARLRQSHLGLYQVEGVEPGRGVMLRDLFTRDTVFVRERQGSEQIVRWDILGARVVTHEDGLPVFDGGLYLYPVSEKTALLRTLKRYRRKYLKQFPDADLASFLKRHGMVFNWLWLDLVVLRPLPQMVTAEGDPMVFSKSVFDLHDEPALRAALQSRDDIDETGEGVFAWLEDDGDAWRSLGTFRIDGPRLLLETTSRARDERGRAWLAAVAPGLCSYRATAIETVAQALARHQEAPPPPSPSIPPEVKARIERDMMDEHYRKWLDQPIPALRGSTPREAAASRTLRPVLLDLLREMENRYERGLQTGRLAYDPAWIRSELGIR